MYTDLKIVTVLSYFIFLYSINSAYKYSTEIWFCEKKMVRDRSL
jgi:hypothetical protein